MSHFVERLVDHEGQWDTLKANLAYLIEHPETKVSFPAHKLLLVACLQPTSDVCHVKGSAREPALHSFMDEPARTDVMNDCKYAGLLSNSLTLAEEMEVDQSYQNGGQANFYGGGTGVANSGANSLPISQAQVAQAHVPQLALLALTRRLCNAVKGSSGSIQNPHARRIFPRCMTQCDLFEGILAAAPLRKRIVDETPLSFEPFDPNADKNTLKGTS